MCLRRSERYALTVLLFILVTAPTISSTVSTQKSRPVEFFTPPAISPTNMSLPLPAIGYSPQYVPVSGTIRVLVIAAAFSNINYTLSIDQVKRNWFGAVAAYYHEISYGKLTVEGDIYGWYKLPYPESHYGMNCLSINDAGCDGQDASWQIAQDVVHLVPNDVNFKNYDYFIFIHSGYGQESSGVKDDVWSVTYMGGVTAETRSRAISLFSVVPELEAPGDVPNGVYCLEFGHDLGLPDLYNTNNGKTILGPWELMDKGSWNGNPPGSSPTHMTAWDKIQLGFISGSQLATANPGVTSTFTVDPTEVASSNVHAIEIPLGSNAIAVSNPSQYYLVEVRSLTGFDSALPAAGVLITYVDETQIIGKVHVIDGHPTTPDLMDAVWNLGQTFTDSKNHLSVTITGKIGKSYQITVNGGGAQPPPIQNQTYVQLAIVSVSTEPSTIITSNTTVSINIQISNLGTMAATNIPVKVTLDGELLTNLQVASIGAGSSTQTGFTWLSTLGSHVFQVTLDPNDTINEPSRANNVATFNLYVGPTLGPTLTINVPNNATTANNIWVSIDGVKYNMTSNWFQSSVPNGTITMQIQPVVNTSAGVRQLFSGWSDGSVANPRRILITANTTLQALYETQYLLSVDPDGCTATPSGWYQPNATVTVTAINPSNVTANASRYLFTSWSGDVSSNSTTITVTMNKPVTLQANWIRQYYVTIISPAGSPTGEGWYDAGTIATVGVQSTVQYSNGTRMIFNGWNSTSSGNNPTAWIRVYSPTRLIAAWRTQYLVTVNSEYGTPLGGGWYDVGSFAQATVPAEVAYTNATRRVFAGWTGDFAGSSSNVTLRVDAPKTLTAEWNTQYLVTFAASGLPNSTILKLNVNNATYELPATSSYQAWVQRGATINPTLNQTIASGIMTYKFTGWRNSTGAIVQGPLAVNAPSTYTAYYTTELSLPPIPGFPIEGIFLGILLGLVAIASSRRRKRKTDVCP